MKKIISIFFLVTFFQLVHSQEVVILGCQGEITEVTTLINSPNPVVKTTTNEKLLTEIRIDKKNKIIRVQDRKLDVCNEGSQCVCNFNENNYECKTSEDLKTNDHSNSWERKITIGRKTGITNFNYWSQSTFNIKNDSYMRMETTLVNQRGKLSCEIKEKNKF